MKVRLIAMTILCGGLLNCGSSADPAYIAKLRAAVDRAELSLVNSIAVAEAQAPNRVGIQAQLLVDVDPVYKVGALTSGAFKDVRVDIMTGAVLSEKDNQDRAVTCPGSVPVAVAIAAAEDAVHGNAVSIQADDDDKCLREVKVLSGDKLWEVKISREGTVLETEEDDSDSD